MRNRTLRSVVAIAVAAVFTTIPAFAELPFTGFRARGPAQGISVTLDATVALYVKYVGTSSGIPTIQVAAATGDIQFEVDGAVDTTVACPEADDDGIIDVSDAACNTMIEVVNAINQGGSNWRAVLVNVLGADSSNDAFATLTETDTNVRLGAPIYYDDNFAGSAPTATAALLPPFAPATGTFFFTGPGGGLNVNPLGTLVTFLSNISTLQDSAGTIAATTVSGVLREYKGNATTGFDLSETARTVWTQVGAADDTQGTLDFGDFPLVSQPGELFIARIGSSTTMTSHALAAAGIFAERQ